MSEEIEDVFEEQSEPPDLGPLSAATATAGGGGVRVRLERRAEELFRGLWASVFYSGRTSGKMLLLSASARREGVTTIACGLGLVDSEVVAGPRVALVDFNLRYPAVHRILGLRQGPGLTEALTDGNDLKSIAQTVNQGLDVFTIGSIGTRSLEMLRSDAVERFFGRLAEAYDYVIIDSAAANHYPDAQVLAGVVKEAALVVHSDRTPREAVAQAKKRVEAGGGRVVGVVLNLRTFPIPNFLYRRV